MLKKIVIISVLTGVFISCNNAPQEKGKMTYGSPKATITTEPNNVTEMKGPLAYGTQVPATMDGDTIDVKFDVHHQLFKVAPGVSFTAWTFGNAVPGPVLKVSVGQTVRFSMTDRSNEAMTDMAMHVNMAPMQHSIDFHAAMVNPEDKYRTVQPGETIHFLWTANYPGVFMYHCGTPMVLMHMIYGMVGMVIVEPKGGFEGTVDHEFALVQNEYYLKKEGDVYVPDIDIALLKQPTYVTFNGKIGQYVVEPLQVKAGEKIRLYLMNVGPNNATNFHIIGTILDKVWLDGNPKNQLVGMQSVYLGPASSAIIEFILPEKGRYTFVDHSFADAEKGAMGAFVAE